MSRTSPSPTASAAGKATAARPRALRRLWLRFSRSGSLAIDLYRLLLLLLIVIYYSALLSTVVKLAAWTVPLAGRAAAGGPLELAALAGYLCLGVPLAVQFSLHIWQGLCGVVTPLHDVGDALIDGLLLKLDGQPELGAWVGSIAERVGSPPPDEIRVGHRVECYVAESRRFGIRRNQRLVLVLGLPQLAVLSVEEMAVIIGHELAHFRRGDTSLGVFSYRFLESLRVSIVNLRGRRRRWCDPLYPLARLYFRLFLHLSAPIRRWQELRCDRISAAAFGGELAASTLLKEWFLAHQFDALVDSLGRDAAKPPSSDTVFDAFVAQWRGLSGDGQDYLQRRLAEEELPGFADSHPTTNRRITAMRSYPRRPAGSARPARELLRGYDELKGRLHAACYRSQLGTMGMPIPVAAVPCPKAG